MKKMLKRITAGLLTAAFLVSSISGAAPSAAAATLSNSEDDNAVTVRNEYVELSVNKKNAGYVIKTIEGDVLTKTDNNKPLNYRGGEGDTSFATLRINGKNYIYGNTKNGGRFITEPYIDADRIISTWVQDDICVTQTLTVLNDSQDEKLGAVKIDYTVWNTNDASEGEAGNVNVGARLVLDSQLGAQDYAVYEMAPNDVNGTYIQYTRETEILKDDMSAHFRSLDNNYQPRVVAYGYPDDSGTKPDRMIFGHWYAMAENLWDYEIIGHSFVDTDAAKYKTADSAVALYWNEESLAADAKRTYSYYYGIQSNEDVGETDSVKLSVSMDKDYLVLNEDKTGYVDDEVSLQVMVSNTLPNSKTRPRMAVKLAIDTDYLSILSAQDDNGQMLDTGKEVIFMSNLKKGQTRVINWKLKVKNPPETIRYLKYFVKAYAFNDQTEEESSTTLLDSNVIDTVKRNILAPGISGDKPSVSILAGIPDELYYKGNRTFVIRGEGFDILAGDKTEWQLKMTDLQTGEESFIDSTQITFNSDGTAMIVNFTEEMAEGEYQLTIMPGENLTDEQIGMPETITSDEMKFFMSSDEDLINPPVGGVGIRKDDSGNQPRYEIDVFKNVSEANDAARDDKYLLVLTGNLYQNAATEAMAGGKFIPVQGSGKEQSILINKIVSFSGEEIIIDYLYEGDNITGVQVKMEGAAGVVGGSNKVWDEESKIVLENGKDYSLDPDETTEGFCEPIEMEMTGIAGIVQKISGFIVDLKYGVFNRRSGYNTISFGGNLSIGFMSVDQYDGVDGVDLFEANVQDVRYGERKGRSTGFIGIKADTFVGVPQFISALPADLEGSLAIDTIDHEYLVNVAGEGEFATFKAEFELEVIASKEHGIPVPNIMSLKVGGVKPGAPIILPVLPVVYLQGAGGKIDNLYSLFYPSETGGWPDTSITLEGQLSIIDVFSGWVGITVGTSQVGIHGDKLKILGMDLLKHVSGTFRWYPEVSFKFDASMELIKVIQGNLRCYLLMYGENAPDLDIYGDVAIVLPFGGTDYKLVGVGIGGNKTKLYGTTTFLNMDVAFAYYWGDKSLDVKTSLFRSRFGSGEQAGSVGINNIYCVAKSTGELSKKADTPVMYMRAAKVSNPEANIDEDGSFVLNGMSPSDSMIRAYYHLNDGEEELKIDDINVTVGGKEYKLTSVETDEEGNAINMDKANLTYGSDELGNYILVSVKEADMTGDVVISSDKATFEYGEAMVVAPVLSVDSISAQIDSDSLEVTLETSNTDNATGTKEIYLSETAEGDRAYPVLVPDEEGNTHSLDADTSALEIPYYVPSGDYYVTTVLRGEKDGNEFNIEKTTTEKITFVNPEAPTAKLTGVSAVPSGDGNAEVTLSGYDSAFMDGVYVVADRKNSDGTETKGYQAVFVDNANIKEGKFEVQLSPEEAGNDYTFNVYPIKDTAIEGEEPKYALGYKTSSAVVNVPYPDAADVTLSYGAEYVEEERTLGGSDSESEELKYTAKVFTTVPEDGIKIEAVTDKNVTGKILIDDEIVSEITVPGTVFPVYYAKLEDGEHQIKIETETEDGDTRIVDESVIVDTTAPDLQMFTPETGTLVTGNGITISGQTEPGVVLSATINDADVDMSAVDTATGSFEANVAIPETISNDMIYELILTAEDAYGRKTIAKASLMNSSVGNIESVYLAFDGEKINGEKILLAGKTSGKLSLYAVTESGDEFMMPDDAIEYVAADDGENEAISVDLMGNVTINGEGTLGVAAQYYVTEDYCYQADVMLDSYKEQMKSEDAKEPVISKNLIEETVSVSAGEEITLSVDAQSQDDGEIVYTWYQKSADGEFREIKADGKELALTLEDKGTVNQYYVAITNKIRTTGIEENTVISPIVTVYVKDEISVEDITVTGNSVVNGDNEYYSGDITVKAKEEGVEIAFVSSNGDIMSEWADELTIGDDVHGTATYKIALRKNGQYVSEAYSLVLAMDYLGPKGTVTVGKSTWNKFLEIITFGIFEADEQNVTITAEDTHAGIGENAVAYYKSRDILSLDEVKALSDDVWTYGTETAIEDGEAAVVYVKLTDKLGNVSYISSDGVAVGNIEPVAEFVYDGETLMEGTTDVYKDVANLTVKIRDDAVSNGLKSVTYSINNGAAQTVQIADGQLEAEIPVILDTKGINTITVTAKDKMDKEVTIADTVKVYKSVNLSISVVESIYYNGKAIEAGKHIIVKKGDAVSEVSYSYCKNGENEYVQGLPTDAGIYNVKAVIAQDDTNYTLAAEAVRDIEILKAAQTLTFSSECYKPVTGEKINVIVGGVKTGDVTFKAADESIIRIISDEITYDAETSVASVPVEALKSGSTTITAEVKGNDNYEKAVKSVNVQVSLPVIENRPYTIEAVTGNNGWYKSDVKIVPAAGYTISTSETGTYNDSFVVTGEGKDKAQEQMFFKNADGSVAMADIDEINIDMTSPEGEVKAGESGWRKFLNTITFGLFFKDTVVVEATASDAVSGVDKIEYYCANDAKTMDEIKALNDSDWNDSSIKLEKEEKAVVYVKITDKAGNIAYLSTDGIIVDKTAAVIDTKPSYDTESWITAAGASIEVNVSDTLSEFNDDGVTYQIDAGTVFAGSKQFTINGLDDGVHNILITATDKAGNTATKTVAWKQDTAAPTVSLSKTSATAIGIKATAGASGIASVQIAMNGGAFTDITASYMNGYTISAGGTYEVRVTNGAGVTVNATIVMDDIRTAQTITTDKDVYSIVYGKNKSFKIDAKSDKATALTYDSSDEKVAVVGSDGKVSVKGYGKAEIVIRSEATSQYNAAEKKVTIKVLPKKPTLKALASKKKKTMIAGWKRDKKVSGYQITYADNKKFKKAKSVTVKKNKITSVTIKKLKKRTYYVKVRSYKLSAGEKIYSSYSKVKKVRVK